MPTRTPQLEQQATPPHLTERRLTRYRQPLKTLYLLSQFCFVLLFRLPLLCFRNVLRSQRPSPNWTWLQSISVTMIRVVVRIGTNAGAIQSRKDVTRQDMPSEKEVRKACGSSCKAVWVEPVDEDDIVGEVRNLMIANRVKPAGVAAYWYGDSIADAPIQKAAPNEKVLVQFHGGGYVVRG